MSRLRRPSLSAILLAVLGLLYAWVGVAASGLELVVGIAGAMMIIAAPHLHHRGVALALLLAGALPLAVLTWWSIVTPVLAIVTLVLGLVGVRRSPGVTTAGRPA